MREVKLTPISSIKIEPRQRSKPQTAKDVAAFEAEMDILAESISIVGLIHPVVLDRQGKLLAGERRIMAHQRLKRTEIPSIVIDSEGELNDLKRLQVEFDENEARLNFTWPDKCKAAKKLYDLRLKYDPKWTYEKQAEEQGLDRTKIAQKVQLAEAFMEGRMGRIVQMGEALETLKDLENCESEDAAWKALKRLEEESALKSKRSKLSPEFKSAPKWAEDHYRIGNTLEFLPSQEPEMFDFVEVDPPYAVDLVTRKDSRNMEKAEAYTEWTVEAYANNMQLVADNCYRVMKQNTFGIFWYGTRHHCLTYNLLVGAGFAVNPVNAIWYKGQSGQADQPDVAFSSCYEPFFLVRKGKPKFNVAGHSNVFDYHPLAASTKRHPTQKPLALMEDILNTICRPGNRVLVPFLGSGVTLIAAYKLQMTGTGWDLSEKNREKFLDAVRKEFGK